MYRVDLFVGEKKIANGSFEILSPPRSGQRQEPPPQIENLQPSHTPTPSNRLKGTVTLDIDPTTNLIAAPTCPVIRSKSFYIGQQPTEHCGPEHHQPTPDDKTIRANVEELIINDEWLGDYILFATIEVRNGVVSIRGKLPTEEYNRAAERKISTIRGVKKVEFVR